MVLLAAFALLGTVRSAQGQAPSWRTFAPKGEGYSIALPSEPRLQTQSQEGVTTRIYFAPSSKVIAIASKSTLPRGFKEADARNMVTALRTSLLQAARATNPRSASVGRAGLKGEETTFDTRSGGIGRTWIARTPSAVYCFSAAVNKATDAKLLDKFFSSLRIQGSAAR